MQIPNIRFTDDDPVYQYGRYVVLIGALDRDGKGTVDVQHYLIVNTDHSVIERSTTSLTDARAWAFEFERLALEQDKLIEANEPLYDSPKASIDKRFN